MMIRVRIMGGYTLDNYYRLEGTGMDLKLGVIVRPIESSPFRFGICRSHAYMV